jgi:ligand-binding SRPBCC domain-containing protein
VEIGIEEAWDFFSNPANLATITPDDMNFEVLDEMPAQMYEGMLVRYKVSPFKGLRLNWTSEITNIKHHEYFIDEQIEGPYKYWHHEHHFKKTATGVELKDLLYYQMPLGKFGRLMHQPLVRKKLYAIFAYRQQKIESMFTKIKVSDG